jgi:hypothetical protein
MKLKTKIASWSRWLHIYISMFSFVLVLFFSITGITLNHLDWFPEKSVVHDYSGKMPLQWVNQQDTAQIKKLEIVEYLRKNFPVKGLVNDFRIDDAELSISFQGPGYTADAYIDRTTGNLQLSTNELGFVAMMNDLHKGRDTTSSWRWLIDASAYFLIFISLSGIILLLYLKKRRIWGLLLLLLGFLMMFLFI